MRVKKIRWPDPPFLCFHCGLNLAEFEAELDFKSAVVNQCLCSICATNLADDVILGKALRRER